MRAIRVRWAAIALAAGLAAFFLLLRRPLPHASAGTYAGSASCAACHRDQYLAWRSSHHARAQAREIAPPLAAAFLSPPGGREGEGAAISAVGPDGRRTAFRVWGTIGVDPLVQALVSFDGGRLQPTALAWDVRRGEWFDLHAPEDRRPEEWGHWTGRGMTWNLQCGYCHTTSFRKGYDVESDTYRSAWLEDGVGCEACHGPRREGVVRTWLRLRGRPPEGTIHPDKPRPSAAAEIETCAPCHARRGQIAEGFAAHLRGAPPSETFLDYFDPVLPSDPAYYADGQVREEDYEWTSFAQSRMHAKQVRCTDCHDPHTDRLRSPGNALCLRCHRPEMDSPAHLRHARSNAGSLCVSCHMPQTTYMLRHPRRDHAMTIPQPELTAALGIPNACNRCHADRDAAWAAETIRAWYGGRTRPTARAQLVAAAREGRDSAVPGLLAMLQSETTTVWRAAAAELLAAWPTRQDVRSALARATGDGEALVRARAVRSLAPPLDDRERTALATRLDDPVRLVRVAAAATLERAGVDVSALSDGGRRAAAELEASMKLNGDTPLGRWTLARSRQAQGDVSRAEAHYRAALRMDGDAHPIRLALAALLIDERRFAEAVALLEEGTRRAPHDAQLFWALAVGYVQTGSPDAAIEPLRRAVQLDPANGEARELLGQLEARSADRRRRRTYSGPS